MTGTRGEMRYKRAAVYPHILFFSQLNYLHNTSLSSVVHGDNTRAWNFCVNPEFHPMSVGWKLALSWKVLSSEIGMMI